MTFTESRTMELKRKYTDGINKSVIAFANTTGGTISVNVPDAADIAAVFNADMGGRRRRISSGLRWKEARPAPASEAAIRAMILETDGDQCEIAQSMRQELSLPSPIATATLRPAQTNPSYMPATGKRPSFAGQDFITRPERPFPYPKAPPRVR